MTLWTTIRRESRPASALLVVCLLCAGMAGRAQQMPSPAALAAMRSSPLTLPEADFPDGYVGLPFGGSVLATGGSGLYSIVVGGNLPPGMYIERGGGVVTLNGVPTQPGTYEIRVGVTDVEQGGTVAHTYSVRIQPQLLDPRAMMVTVSDAEGFKLNDADSVFFPAKIADVEGFKLNDADSVFMPTKITDAEGFTFKDTVSVFGPDKPADPENVKLGDIAVVMLGAMIGDAEGFKLGDTDVVKVAVGVSPATAPAGTYNTSYSQVFTAVGNTGTVTLTTSGTLPNGVNFTGTGSSRALSGTPTQTGTFPFSIKAQDTVNTTTVNYSLVINPASQTITPGTLPTPVYGGANFALSATATSGSAVTIASTSALATGSNPFTPAGAGTASFQASVGATTNYNAATLNFNVSISPAPLMVKATNATRAFDQPNPSFGYSFGTFVNGDTSSVVSGVPAFSALVSLLSPVTPLSPVSGSPYVLNISQGTLAAANYSFNFSPATLTVTQAPQTITFYPLPTLSNGATFPLSARASSGLPVSYSVSGGSITNNILTVTASSGSLVTVTASQSGNSNYNAATSVVRSFTAP